MTAVISIPLASHTYATVAATYDSYVIRPAEPDPYVHIVDSGLRCRWWVTSGPNPSAPVRARGRAWSRDRAVGKATAALYNRREASV